MAGRRPHGVRQHPRRSQHFLRTPELAAELVGNSEIGHDDLVLDIGAGRGRLTEQLARVAARVVAVELDPGLARELNGRWPNVDVVGGDATSIALPDSPFRVVSNLPFHRTTDLMRLLLDDPRSRLIRADLVVEWPVRVLGVQRFPPDLTDSLRPCADRRRRHARGSAARGAARPS